MAALQRACFLCYSPCLLWIAVRSPLLSSIYRSFVTRALPCRSTAVIRTSFSSRSGGFSSVAPRNDCFFFRSWKDARFGLEGLLLPSRASVVMTFVTDAPVSQSGSETYDASRIQVLEGLEAVRKRPGMYIGSTGSRGLHHLVYEVLDNAIDEAQAGFANQIVVVLFADGSASVTDNGRGIPTDIHPITKKPALETVLTVLHAGGKFGGDQSGYIVSGGLHGVGLSVVNALSEKLEVTVWRNGMEYFQTYERGIAVSNLITRNRPSGEKFSTGTCVKFWPDKKVFTSGTIIDYDIIAGRTRELAFLNPGVTIWLQQENGNLGKNQSSVYHYPGGLVEYVQWLNADKKGLHEPIAFKREKDGISLETVLQWCGDVYTDTLLGYANSIRTSDGGTHLEGAKAAITRTLNNLGRKTKVIKEKDENLSGEHAREGLTCIVAVRLQNPEFEGQTKTRLGNPEVRKIVEQTVHEFLTEHLELYPATLDAVLSKAIQALKAALAARKARELVRQKSILQSSTLPGKLSDCSCSDPKDAEIFIVEGDSAGGSAKQGRDRHFQVDAF
eukprot:c29271_g1_i3 orf=170-1843(+)